MTKRLEGKRVAIVATDLVEQVELVEPRKALEDAGATTELLSLEPGTIQGVNHHENAGSHRVDGLVADADPRDYDALYVPGGVANPDRLRADAATVNFVREFHAAGRPIAAMCHGPWLLVEADIVRGRTVTSFPSIRTDLRNAGANWVDEEVVHDGGLITSRKPDDIPALNQRMIEVFAVERASRREPAERAVV